MKRTKRFLFGLPIALLLALGCESYINEVEPMKDYAPDDQLNTEANIDFLNIGVLSQFADASSQVATLSDLLSDQLIFTNMMPLATYPQFDEIENGAILLDNNSVSNLWMDVCRYRRLSDDLVRRAGIIQFSDTTIRNNSYYIGYLHGGLSRFYMATLYGINETTPGGVIDGGAFISQATMLSEAVSKMQTALLYQDDPALRRVINSLIARVYLARADYANAAAYAAIGMAENEDAFACLYSDVNNNYYWQQAGDGRQQIGVDPRFLAYLTADPAEEARIPLDFVAGRDGNSYPYQIKYPLQGSSFPIMTWQENNLMLAECVLRGSGAGTPLTLVNAVRASHGLGGLPSINIAGIMVERDKELFCRGTRLMDQHRDPVSLPWHLGPGTWGYLPVPQNERDANPNLPPY